MTKPLRLLFVADIGGPLPAHVGDEAMLEANLSLFRRMLPSAELTITAADPIAAGQLFGVHAVPRLAFPSAAEAPQAAREEMRHQVLAGAATGEVRWPAVSALLEADVLIISGGGNLSAAWPDLIYERAALARIATLRSIPIVVLGQTLGPDLEGRERDLVGEMLRCAAWVGVREAPSYALALELGVDPKRLSYQLDDAACIEPEPSEEPWTSDLHGAGAAPWVAVTIHPFCQPSPNDPNIIRLAGELKRISDTFAARLIFIPHVNMAATGTSISDAAFGEALAGALGSQSSMRVGTVLPPRQACWLTQQAALVVSSRYHPIVFGLANCVPSVGLWTDQYTRVKLQGALVHAGRIGDAFPLFDAVNGDLSNHSIQLLQSRVEIINAISERRAIWKKLEDERCRDLEDSVRSALRGGASGRDRMSEPARSALIAGLSEALLAEARDTSGRRLAVLKVELGNAVEYARSLEKHATVLERSRAEAEQYAKSLEALVSEQKRELERLTSPGTAGGDRPRRLPWPF